MPRSMPRPSGYRRCPVETGCSSACDGLRGSLIFQQRGAWLGLVPRQYSTGGRSVLGRISKRGSKYLRTLLIQAAKVLLMRPHNWSRYSFGAWLEAASERLHPNKLAVALANKLARIAWSVLRYDKAFDTHLEVVAI